MNGFRHHAAEISGIADERKPCEALTVKLDALLQVGDELQRETRVAE
jgi:hypothetical protein